MRIRKDGQPDGRCTRVWPARVPNHGTVSEYYRGCRCYECRAAELAKDRRWRSTAKPKHGTRNAYFKLGCRCDVCRTLGSEINRINYAKRKASA